MKKIILCLVMLCLVGICSGCGQSGQEPFLETITYSNLLDNAVKEELAAVMEDAGIAPERQQVFFDHVAQFNQAVSTQGLVGAFAQAALTESAYDPYAMMEDWNAAHPDFLGYNCRITAFGLFGDFVEIPSDAPIRDDAIFMDMAALEADGSVLLKEGDWERFQALYSTVPTEASQEISVHVEAVQKDWQERGIVFTDETEARLITVMFHEEWGEHILFIGHAGILFPVSDDELYFLEKIAFQEPYQLTKFENRTQLNDYLMAKYDINEGQPTAPPFILENGQLLEGYRRNRTP